MQISDLHNATFGKNNRKLLDAIKSCSPDMIVITGDLVYSNHTDVERAVSFVEQAVTIAPVYYVTGNHEYWLTSTDRQQTLQGILSAGADLVLSGHAHGGQFRLPFIGGLVAPDQGFLPEYTSGEYTIANTNMIVSRGLGNSIIPVRLFNYPEIVCVELKASPNQPTSP